MIVPSLLTTVTAAAFLRTISVHGYEELKLVMLKEFVRCFSLQVFNRLQARKLKADESVKRNVIDMQEIAWRASIPESELVYIIIEGIGDRSSNVAMLYAARTLDELKVLMTRYERRRLISTPVSSTRSAPTIKIQQAPNNKNGAKSSTTPVAIAFVTAATRCFNCSRFGHYQSQCPLPRRPEGSCFRCSSTTHVYKDCPKP